MARARSPEYPAIGLKDAIERVKRVYDKDYQNKVSKDTIATHMGYKGLSGASLPVLSALAKYGLLEGRGNDTQVSDRALAIIAHEPGSRERVEALKAAAREPDLFAELDDKFHDGKASDTALRAYLLTQKFIPEAADTAIRSYRETKQLVEAESRGYSEPFADQRGQMQEHQRPQPMSPLAELGTPPAPPRPPSARSQGKDFVLYVMSDRLVVDGELPDRETIDMLVDRLKALRDFMPTQEQRRAQKEGEGGGRGEGA